MPNYSHSRPRGFAPWNPSPASLQLIEAVIDILERESDYLPLTARQVFYRMVAHHRYEKTERAYARLCEKLNRARRAGLLSWDSIRDDGETARYNGGHYSVSGFSDWMRRQARRFRLNPAWVQPCRVEVHVEAAGMMPQVAQVACPLGATVYSSGGFGSVTAQHAAAKRMAEATVPTVVLSIGDFDPSGLSLYWAFRENVLAFFDVGARCGGQFSSGLDVYDEQPLFRRIAVTPDQIREHGFETAPRKKSDNRGDWQGETVQCEAIPSRLLAEIVRLAVLEHYDEAAITAIGRLAERTRGPLGDAYDRVDLGRLPSEVRSAMSDIRFDAIDGADWTGGYTNDDEANMEEGV